MLYVIIAVCVFLLFAGIVLFSKFKIFFEYKKLPGEKLYKKVNISFGFVNLTKLLYKLSKKAKRKTEGIDKSDKAIIEKIKKTSKTFKTVKKIYAKNRWHIRNSLNVEKLDFHIKFGLSDAAVTGIATGAIWTLLYSLTALIAQVGTLKKHYFEVCPVFTEKGLICQGSVKLSVRMIDAIVLVTRLYLTYRNINKPNK